MDRRDVLSSDWAQHGISGRGVFLDMVKFYTDNGKKPLPYDPWNSHGIPPKDLEACAQKEGVEFCRGDILVLRVGFLQKWYAATRDERDSLHKKPETLYAGQPFCFREPHADVLTALELSSRLI